MGRYRLTRRIGAPPERVFAGFTDPSIVADWMDLKGIADATGPLDVAGTRYTMVVRGPWRFRVQVLRSESPRLHDASGRGPLGASYRMVARLTGSADVTDLELDTEYTLPFGAVGRWIDRRWLENSPRTVANRELDRLVTIMSGSRP